MTDVKRADRMAQIRALEPGEAYSVKILARISAREQGLLHQFDTDSHVRADQITAMRQALKRASELGLGRMTNFDAWVRAW